MIACDQLHFENKPTIWKEDHDESDESEDENDEEWIAPNEERNAFNLFDDLFDEA